jgi:prepilin-type N-terminal cleavage/methylation domain-containing protein
MRRNSSESGFSLVEIMVAIGLFAVVMVVSTGSLLALVDANRKSQALHSVMTNLNVALDGMVRAIRMGTYYHCGNVGSRTEPRDCSGGDILLAFEPYGGDPETVSDQWVYWYDAVTKRLYKSEDGGTTGYAITAPEVEIEDMQFYVIGSSVGDTIQPKVVIVIDGTAGSEKVRTRTTFNIQATASQRVLDL